MSRFVFRLEPLLKYRRHYRDLCATLLGQLLANGRELDLQKESLKAQHRGQLDEIRNIVKQGQLDIDRAANRRYFAGHLIGQMHSLSQQRSLLEEQIQQCRQTLIEADRNVKVLEKLREKQYLEFQTEQLRKTERELSETWLAAHAVEFSQ
ncbi:MAG: hypothetical protein Tsb009_02380 [Planctomycetaceae bacterium]